MTHPCFVGAIVLAGGRSQRMGTDKALVSVAGCTLIERVVTAVSSVSSRTIIVAATADSYRINGAETIADLYPGKGPVGGICTGLSSLGEGLHIVVACDMPGVQPEVLRLMLNSAQPGDDAIVVGCIEDQTTEPLCAIYRHSALLPLTEFMSSDRRSVRAALGSLNVRYLDWVAVREVDPEGLCFLNINSKEDLAELEARL